MLTNAITRLVRASSRGSALCWSIRTIPRTSASLHLFKNRAEMKKTLGDAQDELHRLKDRIKLQEAATARVREQLEQLEARLAAPLSGPAQPGALPAA